MSGARSSLESMARTFSRFARVSGCLGTKTEQQSS